MHIFYCTFCRLSFVGIVFVYWNISLPSPSPEFSSPFLRQGIAADTKSAMSAPIFHRLSLSRDRYENVTCSDSSVGKWNDAFCDCLLEGEDEPSTGACSWYSKPAIVLYTCAPAKQHYIPKHRTKSLKIYSSRIRDGICDCQDCRDER